jgi:hypothetical protein
MLQQGWGGMASNPNTEEKKRSAGPGHFQLLQFRPKKFAASSPSTQISKDSGRKHSKF